MPPTAYLGLVGLAATAWLFLLSCRRAADNGKLPLEAWFLIWIFLYAEVGGLDRVGSRNVRRCSHSNHHQCERRSARRERHSD